MICALQAAVARSGMGHQQLAVEAAGDATFRCGRMLASLARFRLFYGLPPAPAGADSGSGASSSEGGSGGGSTAAAAGVEGGAAPAAPAAALVGAEGEAAVAAAPGSPAAAGAPGAAAEDNDGLPPGFSSVRAALWAANGDHNLLRITRIIRSLRFLGLQAESAAFYRDVLVVARWAGLSRTTLGYWRKASEDDVWHSMRG